MRYRVLPAGERLALPDADGPSLQQWAETRRWARSGEAPYRLPDGTAGRADRLAVRVGEWPAEWIEEGRRERAREEMDVARERGWAEDPPGFAEERMSEVRRLARTVDPASVLPEERLSEETGLTEVLRSGRFAVTGNVYFSPLQPLQPEPQIPTSIEEARDRYISFERLRYTYPNEAPRQP